MNGWREPAPDEREAEARAWNVVRGAFAERERLPMRRRRWPLVAAAAAAALVAAALSPPGVAVLDSIRDAVRGEPNARPALFSLPAAGRLLVDSAAGTWVVERDGSKRLLGHYRDPAWSPRGLYLAAIRGRELQAIEPDGDVHWSIARPGRLAAPRWSDETPPCCRIAYLAGRTLRVVNGDGTGDRVLARDVLGTAAAWRPGTHELAYAAGDGDVRIADADAGRILETIDVAQPPRQLSWARQTLLVRGRTSLVALGPANRRIDALGPGAAEVVDAALSPDGTKVAFVQHARGRSTLWLYPRLRADATAARRIFSGAGRIDTVTWSPDGRWLLVGWRSADQWLFIRSTAVRKVVAVSNIAATFGPDASIAGWCCS